MIPDHGIELGGIPQPRRLRVLLLGTVAVGDDADDLVPSTPAAPQVLQEGRCIPEVSDEEQAHRRSHHP